MSITARQLAEAEKEFKVAFAIDSRSMPAVRTLATFYTVNGRGREAAARGQAIGGADLLAVELGKRVDEIAGRERANPETMGDESGRPTASASA